ncbi:MAG: hypothetical protein LLG97_07930 [Deltaproteobacteria bacterium]|nr:hypothetical protein [Deltaproteobacteria bacterium]
MDGKTVLKRGTAGSLSLCIAVMVLFSLTGCTLHLTKQFSSKLDPDALYTSFNVNPEDLSTRSKCNAPPTVKIVNMEERTEDFVALENPPANGVINPKEMMDSVCLYLKNGFERSRIKADDQSDKVIQVKMVDLKSIAGVWSFGSYFKMQLIIPETKLTKFYEAKDNSMQGHAAAANAIHRVTRQIIEDPEIQDYLLCR